MQFYVDPHVSKYPFPKREVCFWSKVKTYYALTCAWGRCFVRTQQEFSVTAALKVHKIKTTNLAQENNWYLNKFTDW